ncbi:MAG: M6 family metalloprotease domain-containing protein, partial [Prevotella sp.]
DEKSGASDIRVLDFAADASVEAQDLADFTKYDWDNDGVVDNVYIIFAGYSEAMGASDDCIWPHQWVISDRELYIDGKRIFNYACSNELLWSSGKQLNGIGTACHEFSHTLGLMDTYNTVYGITDLVQRWDVMSAGSYLGKTWGTGTAPTAYTAYERWSLGWLEPTELNVATTVTGMKPLENDAEAYVLYNEGNRNEFYMLENRQFPKWGNTLGAHGLMVTHIDYDEFAWYNNSINAVENLDDQHFRFSIISANDDLYDYSGVLFPGTTGKTSFTNTSTPAATLFNLNDDGSTFLNKPIEDITESDDGTISFVACPGISQRYDGEIMAKLNSDGAIACEWGVVADAVSYDVELSAKTSTPSPYNHVIMEEKFDNVPKEDGTEDISSQLNQYTDNYWYGCGLYSAVNGIRIASVDGYYSTAAFKVEDTNNATFVFDIEPYVNGETTEGYLCLLKPNFEERDWWELSLDKQKKYICNISIDKYKYYFLQFYGFTAPVCLSGISIYDGIYDEEDFTKESQPSLSEETLSPEQVNTTANSVLFSDIQKGYNYSVRVRSHLSDGSTSIWSQPVAVDMTTDVNSVISDAMPSQAGQNAIYNVTGRRVTSVSRPGIYIQNGKKIVISK